MLEWWASAISFQAVLYTHDFARKNKLSHAASFDYLRLSCEIPCASRRGHRFLTNLLVRGKVVPLTGDVVVEYGKPAECLPLLDAETGE